MRRSLFLSVFVLLVGLLATPVLGQAPDALPVPDRSVENQWIVVFDDSMVRGPHNRGSLLLPSAADVAAQIEAGANAEFDFVWEHALRGARMQMTEAEARRVARNPRVQYVEQDQVIASPLLTQAPDPDPLALNALTFESLPLDPQDLPKLHVPYSIQCDDPDPRNPNRNCPDNWGLDRIDETAQPRDGDYDLFSPGNSNVHIYTIDTGAFAGHDDFEDLSGSSTRVTGGINATVPAGHAQRNNTQDCLGNSHGTHVAGIAIGKRYGVAKDDDVTLHPVKYYDACVSPRAGGTASVLVEALDWIVANHNVSTMGPAVVNFSGGNNSAFVTTSTIQAVQSLNNDGILLVQSAGNQYASACSRSFGGTGSLSNGVLIVGGIDENQNQAIFDGRWRRETNDPSYSLCSNLGDCGSNAGSCLDLWAPAAHIISAANQTEFPGSTSASRRLSGTSMAAPHVTGALAEHLRRNPSLTPAQLHQAALDQAICGELDTRTTSPYYIGSGSPDILLEGRLLGNTCP